VAVISSKSVALVLDERIIYLRRTNNSSYSLPREGREGFVEQFRQNVSLVTIVQNSGETPPCHFTTSRTPPKGGNLAATSEHL